jgi:hypothetical protein
VSYAACAVFLVGCYFYDRKWPSAVESSAV